MTLVEVLVVIAIIAVLIGLLLPAVQAARESSRRTTCSNNVSQLAKAILQIESSFGSFPSAGWGNEWLGATERGSGLTQPGGWTFAILPYLEQSSLQASIEHLTAANAAEAYGRLLGSSIPALSCPTRRPGRPLPIANPVFRTVVSATVSVSPAVATRSDYAGSAGAAGNCPPLSVLKGASSASGVRVTICHGAGRTRGGGGTTLTLPIKAVVNDGHASHDDDHLGACNSCDGPMNIANPATVADGDTWSRQTLGQKLSRSDGGIPDIQDGVFARMDVVSSGQILDGLSRTYLVGEKYVAAGSAMNGTDVGDAAAALVGFSSDNLRWSTVPPRQDEAGRSHPSAFGSAHASGWAVAFADGSVRALSYTIDPEVHRALGSRADGTIVTPP